MRELTCIVCPRGCTLQITGEAGNYTITGNACKRGEQFATAEMTCPMRTICTTVKTAFPAVPVISVRTSREIPKERIFDVMREINSLCITHPTGRGEVILQNVLGLGTDIIVTADWPEEQDKEDRYEQ